MGERTSQQPGTVIAATALTAACFAHVCHAVVLIGGHNTSSAGDPALPLDTTAEDHTHQPPDWPDASFGEPAHPIVAVTLDSSQSNRASGLDWLNRANPNSNTDASEPALGLKDPRIKQAIAEALVLNRYTTMAQHQRTGCISTLFENPVDERCLRFELLPGDTDGDGDIDGSDLSSRFAGYFGLLFE